jgi:deoxyribonuclease-4
MKLGLHISTAGNLAAAPERARAMGADTIQIFASSPRMWRPAHYTAEQGSAFRAACEQAHISPVFIHNIYLVSFGTDSPELLEKGIAATRNQLEAADILGAAGVITHMGSHKGAGFEQALPRIAKAIGRCLEGDARAQLILENSAGAGGNIGNSLEEIAAIINALGHPARLAVCIDTAHALAAGYEIRTAAGWSHFLDDFDRLIGLERLATVHLNDSKVDIGSHRDRHENIGDGFIGTEGFRTILNEPRIRDTPGLLEVPGVDGKSGPDAANLNRLRELQ